MKMSILNNADELGKAAAKDSAEVLKRAIAANGRARIVVSTGASQNETLHYLLQEQVEWGKVEVFHLDEYIGLPDNHPASFRRYLKERFLDFVKVQEFHLVRTEGDIQAHIEELTAEIRKAPVDLALIGIGENGHIAFNDPPADFLTQEAFITVNLDEACKRQQVGECCFPSLDDVPKQAVSMTVHQIMQSLTIISSVPDRRKARAVRNTLENELSEYIPATILKRHPDWRLYLDQASASELVRR